MIVLNNTQHETPLWTNGCLCDAVLATGSTVLRSRVLNFSILPDENSTLWKVRSRIPFLKPSFCSSLSHHSVLFCSTLSYFILVDSCSVCLLRLAGATSIVSSRLLQAVRLARALCLWPNSIRVCAVHTCLYSFTYPWIRRLSPLFGYCDNPEEMKSVQP